MELINQILLQSGLLGVISSTVVVLSTLVIINLSLLFRAKWKNYQLLGENLGYPVPKIPSVAFAHMDQIASRKYEFKWHKQLGKIFGLYYCDSPQLKLADLNVVNEIFLKQSKIFNARTWSEYRVSALIKSILFNKGSRWKKIRRIIQPALAEYRIRTNESNVIHDIQSGLDKLMLHFRNLVKNDPKTLKTFNQPFQRSQFAKRGYMVVKNQESPTGLSLEINAYTVLQVITLDVIFRLAFDIDTIDVTKGSSEPSLKTVKFILGSVDTFLYKLAVAIPITRLFILPWMIFLDPQWKAYRKFVSKIVDYNPDNSELMSADEDLDHNAQPKRIRNILLSHYRSGNLTKNELMSNSFAVMVAGFETTATTSTYVLWCIAKHDACASKLRQDIQNYGVESRYLDMFIKEVMRMYPALPNFVIRTPHEDIEIEGLTIKRGMSVYMSVNTIHHDPAIWEDPFRFDPERFAEGKTYPPAAYAPFGLGHRMCAGYQLALREMKSIVCEVLSNFDIQLVAPEEMELVSSSIFLTRPRHEVRLRLIPVSSNESSEQRCETTPVRADAVDSSAETKRRALEIRLPPVSRKLSTKSQTNEIIQEEEVDDDEHRDEGNFSSV